VDDAGEHEPRMSISRVEDSLLSTREGEACQLPRQQDVDVEDYKYTQSNFQSGSRSGRIKKSYLPFCEQRKRGVQSLAKGSANLTKPVNDSFTNCSLVTTERSVFWMGVTNKNSMREERKQLRSALSQISNFVYDMAINNCNHLFWLKHGSLEMIRLWELCKQIRATCGEEGNVLISLDELEIRDRILKSRRKEGEDLGY